MPAAPAPRRGTSQVFVWLIVAAVAAAAFAAAFVYAGGTHGVLDLVGGVAGGQGTATLAQPHPIGPAAARASTESTGSADLGGLPAGALKRMFAAQLRSQASIAALVDNRFSSLVIGTPQVAGDVATVPVTAHLRVGGTMGGFMTLQRFHGLWYVFGLENRNRDVGVAEMPDVAFDPAVVAVITSQQAAEENQAAFQAGLLGGGFTKLKVTGVEKGAGTATVDVTFTGGTAKRKTGRLVCITKRDSSTDYWFIARLAAN